jgi:hypothetical protein
LIATLRTDAFTEFKWNDKAQRYTVRSGAGRSQFTSKQAFFARLDFHITTQKQSLVSLADRLSSGAINLEEFQRSAASLLMDIHTSSGIKGRGGPQRLDRADLERVGAEIKRQLYAGKDGDQKFGIRHVAAEIKAGTVSPAQLRQRLEMYSLSGEISYWESWKRSAADEGRIYAIRVLGDGNHCSDCPRLAAEKPKPIEQVLVPKTGCQCRMRCKCSLLSMDLTGAIERGLKDPRPAERKKKELERIERLGFGRRRRRDAVRR